MSDPKNKDAIVHQLIRLVFMVVFGLLLQVAIMVLWPVVVLQFALAIITGSDNEQLRGFAKSLGIFVHQTLDFLTYNSDEKPFPFKDWPSR
jgi:hypothetical protein